MNLKIATVGQCSLRLQANTKGKRYDIEKYFFHDFKYSKLLFGIGKPLHIAKGYNIAAIGRGAVKLKKLIFFYIS